MARRQSSPPARLIDVATVGERLRRWRQWRGYSQAQLARQARVDPMVISRLEGQQKPRLAWVCGWSLDELCGLQPVALPALRPAYTPLTDGLPDWLVGGLPTSTEERQLCAWILAWQLRGATLQQIADALTAWGVRPFTGPLTWSRQGVQACVVRWTRGTKNAQRALLREYGFTAEARQLAARRVR
jgi:hypothetical protein